MPIQVQAKLLRVLQEQEFEPLGSNRLIKTDVRIIAATSRDLGKLVEEGKFRADLYFRLNVLPITVPPLRDQVSDLEALCETLLEQIAMRTGGRPRDLDSGAFEIMMAHNWPGNIRELRNVLERACMETDRRILTAGEIARTLPARQQMPTAVALVPGRPLSTAVLQMERDSICAALKSTRGNRAEAARILGISRSKLYQRLSALGLASKHRT